MTPQPESEAISSHEWERHVDDHLDRLSADVESLRGPVEEISTVRKLTSGILPTMIIGTLGFVLTAYVAFDRLNRVQVELEEHRRSPALQAHPDLGRDLSPIRESQERILATIEAMQREDARRSQELDARLQRIETQVDNVRAARGR